MAAIELEVSRPSKMAGFGPEKLTAEPVAEGEALLVTFEEAYIGDNHEPFFKGKAEILTNFSVRTHKSLNEPLLLTATTGTLKNVDNHQYLEIQRNTVIAGPFTPAGFVELGIATSELDGRGFRKRFGSIQKILDHVPAVGGVQIASIFGQLVTLLASLDEDDVIISKSETYFTEENTMGDRQPLETGLYTFHSGDLNDPGESRITLAISKHVPKPT